MLVMEVCSKHYYFKGFEVTEYFFWTITEFKLKQNSRVCDDANLSELKVLLVLVEVAITC